jgi:hypothetical protein
MTQAPTSPAPLTPAKPAGPGRSNIYTVLMAIAIAALLTGVIYLCVANAKMTESGNPFTILPAQSSQQRPVSGHR